MENDNVVNGLLRRRQLIADELEIVQGRVRQLVIEIDAVDVTIRLFRPDAQIGVVRVKPIPRRHAALRGESTRMILSALREASEPLTTRQIVRKVMDERGMNTADLAMVETMRLRMATSLRKLRHRGKVTAESEGGRNMRWSLIG
jgi:hypothetical protein